MSAMTCDTHTLPVQHTCSCLRNNMEDSTRVNGKRRAPRDRDSLALQSTGSEVKEAEVSWDIGELKKIPSYQQAT